MYHFSFSNCREVKTCLKNEKVAIIGDSRLRALYYHLADTVSKEVVKAGKKVTILYTRK